nr:uncharacterized protein LOC109150557 [Ipomoea batatas]GME12135.1 uncharacterized protein LOC109150557 [Ipomoea batatas]GME19235.1 uncharacterized protein LOC109150557 [Ipomoea batatas]
MANSYGAGCMAVFVASGTVVLLALRVHKHLMSDFMNKIDAEMGTTAAGRDQERRKVYGANNTINNEEDGFEGPYFDDCLF